MNKLTALIEAAKEGRMDNDYNDTIIELCAVVEALRYQDNICEEVSLALKELNK